MKQARLEAWEHRKVPALILICMMGFAAAARAQAPEYLQAEGSRAGAPFSEAVRVGNMLYLAGKIGIVPGTTKLAEGGIAGETRQTLENIRQVVERHGGSMDNVVKCLVMLADMSEWSAMNEVYVTFFPKNKPARSAFGVTALALNARVEIECVAALVK